MPRRREREGRVLVTDGHTNQALACVRSLGRAGYDVLVASHHRWPLAAWSRFARAAFRLDGQTTTAYAELRDWAARRGATMVFPITEAACFLCNAERAAWEAAGMIVGCGPNTMLLQAFDKGRTLALAARLGLSVPETREPDSREASRAAAEELGYPVIVKPRFSNIIDGGSVSTDLGIAYVDHPTALDDAVLARRQRDHWPLLQRPVKGVGRGIFALCDHGEPVAWFAHERLRDVRPSGSGSSLRRAAPLPHDLREAATRLLRRMAWHGPAMIEFKDDGVHAPWLLEMNGRFWGSLQLAIAAGVDFPAMWARLLQGKSVEPSDRYQVGVTVRWLWGDVKRFVHILRGPPRGYAGDYPGVRQGLRELFGRQPRGTRLETWDPGDPAPSLGQWVQGVAELFEWRNTKGARAPQAVAARAAPRRRIADMRVLMLTSEWPTPDGLPRTTNFIRRQVEFLRAAGVDVDLFHFRAGGRPANYLRAWVQAHRRMAREHYDLVHAQWGQGALPALPTRLPLVVTLRGDDIGGIVGQDLRVTPAGRLLRTLTRRVARLADHVILVSSHMRAALHPSVPTTVIPSGLDLELFRPMPQAEARARLGLPPEERLVLFVGRPATPRKRYALAQEAVAALSATMPARLVVAWGIQHKDLPLYYNAADVMLFTSMQEGSPNVVKEALACNCPVVSVPVGDTAQRLRGVAGCELVTDERPEALAAALERILVSGERSAGREAVRELDEHRTTEQVIAVYRSVLEGPYATSNARIHISSESTRNSPRYASLGAASALGDEYQARSAPGST